ncbi:MAG TPA: tetratricopeptide repeat protein [Anaeromyxobacter sp.]|nr:tetratricopeptide repeat protein [Anaeromyxobacter sp.]
MIRHVVLGAGGGLALGLLVGYQVGRAGGHLLREQEPVVAAAAPAAPAQEPPQAPPPAEASPLDAAERIAAAQAVLDKDPKNVRAWIDLGNLYFDTKQPQKSVDAYARALELDPGNPNVLTDQGVMYRALGAYDRAVANFQKASEIDPQHLQSLYNLGVVYAFDLKDPAKAEAAWNRIIQLAPSSENAAQARQALAQIRGGK